MERAGRRASAVGGIEGCVIALELGSPRSTRGSSSTHADGELRTLYARQHISNTVW